jgi:hypothetical protein
LRVAGVKNTDVRLRRWAVKLVAIGRHGVLQPAPRHCKVECPDKLR